MLEILPWSSKRIKLSQHLVYQHEVRPALLPLDDTSHPRYNLYSQEVSGKFFLFTILENVQTETGH